VFPYYLAIHSCNSPCCNVSCQADTSNGTALAMLGSGNCKKVRSDRTVPSAGALHIMTNGILMQYFHWYVPSDGNFWNETNAAAKRLAELGVNAVWLPPAHKGKDGAESSGYDVYDIYDLGEFDQKGSVRTKYGTKEELIGAVKSLQSNGIGVYVDIVLNHMGGADELETIAVRRVDEENREVFTSEAFDIEAWTKFTFPGRNGNYSRFIWDHKCFTGVDYAYNLQETAIYSIMNDYGEGWEEVIDEEKGNYDYLMFCDIEFRNPAVREELKNYGAWYLDQLGFDGVRLDAVKHMSPRFYLEWLGHMRSLKPGLFAVGEYWAPGDLPKMVKYIEATEGSMSLFDAALHHNLYDASTSGNNYDLRTIFDGSLVQNLPELAVTVVDNHDTQPLQSLEAPVEAWFKPLAYALILLRESGYPCLFYPDLYGAHYTDKGRDGQDHEIFLDKVAKIEELLAARQQFAYGEQHDYFDHANCIGWVRTGSGEQPNSGCAVVICNGDEGFKKMHIGGQFTGREYIDFLQNHDARVKIDEEGWGEFLVRAGSVSVWILAD
jgi:alpha-amylase